MFVVLLAVFCRLSCHSVQDKIANVLEKKHEASGA